MEEDLLYLVWDERYLVCLPIRIPFRYMKVRKNPLVFLQCVYMVVDWCTRVVEFCGIKA